MIANSEDARAIAENLRERLVHVVGFPDRDVASIGVLIDAGEWKVALEVLCSQLCEYDLDPGASEREKLRVLGQELAVPVLHLLGDPWAEAGGGS